MTRQSATFVVDPEMEEHITLFVNIYIYSYVP